MKNFLTGLIVGGIVASLVCWIAVKPKAKVLPVVPFNSPGEYKIRDQSDYLIVERKPAGVEVSIRRSYASRAGEGWGGVSQPTNWIQSNDWFAFVDSDLHIWLFDGGSDLKVLELRDGDTVFFEPSRFTPPVELLNHLPKSVLESKWPTLKSSEQGSGGNALEPPPHPPTAPTKSRATP